MLRLLRSDTSRVIPILIAVAIIGAGIWMFIALGSEVFEGETKAFDRQILLAIRSPQDTRQPLGPMWFQEGARDVTALGSVVLLTYISLATAGFLALEGKGRMAVFLLLAVGTGSLLSSGLKDVYKRPRPDLVPHGAYVYHTSFPSGHSMMSAVTYLSLGTLLARSHKQRGVRTYIFAISVLTTIAVGLSRIYLGVHWPTDVLAGWTGGAVWAVLCWTVATRLQKSQVIEDEDAGTSGSSADRE